MKIIVSIIPTKFRGSLNLSISLFAIAQNSTTASRNNVKVKAISPIICVYYFSKFSLTSIEATSASNLEVM